MAVPLAESGGNSRQKYLSVVVLKELSPATAFIGILARLSIGTMVGADAVPGPVTRTRLDVVASICWTAGSASAGSPRVSTPLYTSLWPRTPPALLIAYIAGNTPPA